jgi:hypothetical protein
MSSAERRPLDANRSVDLDTAATIRFVPLEDMPLDESPTVERRVGARPLELDPPELDNVLRLLTPPVPPVYSHRSDALPRARVESHILRAEPRNVLLSDWLHAGAAFALRAMNLARDAVLLFAHDATFVLRPVIERLWAASRRGAFSLQRGLWQRSRPRHARATVFEAHMTDAEIAILHAIADSWGVSTSSVVRTLVLRECQKADFGVGRPRVPRSVARDRNRLNRVA